MSKVDAPHKSLKDVMTSDVVYVNPQDTLREVLAVMVENHVSAMPVIDARRRCVGVISVTDLLGMTRELSDELNALSVAGRLDHEALVAKLEHADLLTEQVQDLMSPDVVAVKVDSTIPQAARKMLRHGVHRLVVLDEQRHVVGVVSTTDLLAALAGE
jgi:CBS domain-containing protein